MQKIITSAIIKSGDLAGSYYPNPTLSAIKGAKLGTTTANSGNVLIGDGYKWQSKPLSGLVVTSVGLSTNASYLTVGSSPVTGTGTITINKTSGLTANQVVATPDGTTGVADLRALVTRDLPTNIPKSDVIFCADGQGSALASGVWYLANVNFAGTITAWDLVADISGSVVIDVWKANAAVPTAANTITASALPTLSSAQSALNQAPTGWVTSVAVGDVFAFKINSATTITKISLALRVTRT